jgi:hypothetical protein
MSTILVSYDGAPAALVGVRRFSFLGAVRHLPPGHPVVRVVAYMAYYAQLVLSGDMGDYSDRDAELFARSALIDYEHLASRVGESDKSLATHFRIPVEQITKAREELGAYDR